MKLSVGKHFPNKVFDITRAKWSRISFFSLHSRKFLSYLSTCTWRPVHSGAINLASGVNSVSAILTPLSRSLELARPLLSSGPSRRSVGPLMTCCAANSESRVRGGQSFSSRTRDYLAIFCNMHRLLSFLLSSSLSACTFRTGERFPKFVAI